MHYWAMEMLPGIYSSPPSHGRSNLDTTSPANRKLQNALDKLVQQGKFTRGGDPWGCTTLSRCYYCSSPPPRGKVTLSHHPRKRQTPKMTWINWFQSGHLTREGEPGGCTKLWRCCPGHHVLHLHGAATTLVTPPRQTSPSQHNLTFAGQSGSEAT